MASYIIELPLFVNENNCNILDKRFRIAETIYNVLVKNAKIKLNELLNNKSYKETLRKFFVARRTLEKNETIENKEALKTLSKELAEIRHNFGVSEYAFHSYVKVQQNMYKKHIDSNTSQKLATTVWKAVETYLFRKGKKIHFKKFGQLTSVEGKQNTTGIRFLFPEEVNIVNDKNLYKDTKAAKKRRQNMYKDKHKESYRIEWNDIIIPAKIREKDLFINEALTTSKVKYSRLVRRAFKNGNRYFVQLIMDGTPPPKRYNFNGQFRHKELSQDRVGIDIGTSSIAVVSIESIILKELAPDSTKYNKEIIRLSKKLDRSRRATNPDNFNSDGTIKRGIKFKWVRGKNYIKILFELKNLYRLKANYMKMSHNILANEILQMGSLIYVEDMNFSALQRKTKKATINKKTGKFNSRKRFGKSLNNKAPAMLISIIDKKLKYIDKKIIKVNTRKFKASQYNHIEDRCIKKKLSQRWNKIDNKLIQRDLYSAYLIMNSKEDLESTDRYECIKHYAGFVKSHDKYIEDLKQNRDIKLLSSFGIKKTI